MREKFFLYSKTFRDVAENVMSDVTKSPQHFCKFHHKLKESSISAMKLLPDVTNGKSNTDFEIVTVGIGKGLVCLCL